MSLKIATIVGARPQFIKAATISRAIAAHNQSGHTTTIDERIIHTGQHYDANMSQVFFDELGIPAPAVHLGVGSGGHGAQTGAMLEALERTFEELEPDVVLVYGDTNSTLAGAIAAAKLHIPVAHVEAGLRSFNRRMPEEVNRVLTDHVSTWLFCPTRRAIDNLAREGITLNVHEVGDVMFDSVQHYMRLADERSTMLHTLSLEPRGYYLATVHRAENTDDPNRLAGILHALTQLPFPVVLPLHPRTRGKLADGLKSNRTAPIAALRSSAEGDIIPGMEHIRIVPPLSYLDMLLLQMRSRAVLTDSGGVQKESYFCGVPCVTLRDETEWVELVEHGVNRLAGADTEAIVAAVAEAESTSATAAANLYGDGHSAEKIIAQLLK